MICDLSTVNQGTNTLDAIFVKAAPRMALMRKQLKLNPEDFEIVDFLDFVEAMKNMHENEKPLFKERFPTLQSTNVMHTLTFDEGVTKGCTLPKLQKMIEDVLGKDKKCAVSIVQRTHRYRMLHRKGRVS